MDKAQILIRNLQLEPHEEGGYFKRIFTSTQSIFQFSDLKAASSIYYLLTNESSIGYMHLNIHEIIHYFLEGSPITYYLLSSETGKLEHRQLDTTNRFLHVPPNIWKASELTGDQYALIAEVVIPEFSWSNRKIGTREEIKNLYPKIFPQIKHLVKETLS